DLDRMREIGVAARPHLIAMLLHGIDIGAVDEGFVRLRIVAQNPINQFVLAQHRSPVRPPDTPHAHKNAALTFRPGRRSITLGSGTSSFRLWPSLSLPHPCRRHRPISAAESRSGSGS